MPTAREVVAEALESVLQKSEFVGPDHYVFVMYSVKPQVKDVDGIERWFINPIVRIAITLIQTTLYHAIVRRGPVLATWVYYRLLRPYLKQVPAEQLREIGSDLVQFGDPQSDVSKAFHEVVKDQLVIFNPKLTVEKAQPFLNTLGKLVLADPPSIIEDIRRAYEDNN